MVAELRGESRLAQPGGAPRAPPLGGAGLAAVALPRAGKGAEHAMSRESTEEPRGEPVRGRLWLPAVCAGGRRSGAEGRERCGVRCAVRGAGRGVGCGALCGGRGCGARSAVRGAVRNARARHAPDTESGMWRAGCGAMLPPATRPGTRPLAGIGRGHSGGLSCRVPRDDFGGRLRFWGQSRSCRAPDCTTSACSEHSCADRGGSLVGRGSNESRNNRERSPRVPGKILIC